MAGAAIVAARILLIMMAGRMIRLRVELRMMLLHGRSTALVRFTLLRDSGMTVAGHRLHDDRNSQRIAAEQRQPDGQNHCNKFSNGARHVRSLAKSGDSVKYESAGVSRESSRPILPLYLMRCRSGRNLLIIGLFTLQLSRYHARNYDNVMPHP